MTSCTNQNRDYSFNKSISQKVLENYLSRSIEYAGLCCEGSSTPVPYFDDCLRLISNTGAKFIGRAAFTWDAPLDDEKHYKTAKEGATKIHKIDPEIILQSCVFETTYSCKTPESKKRTFSLGGVENIPIPKWVFEEFELPQENRCFSYEKMIFKDGKWNDLWAPGASVPDVTRLETKLWFYYRARCYIDAGYESIHCGQVCLTGANDIDLNCWIEIIERLRSYGKKHARRNYILFDAHIALENNIHFVKIGENLIWDFLSFPLRMAETDKPLNAELKIGYLDSIYGRAPGGIHPSGWKCEAIPQILEFDNGQNGLAINNQYLTWGADEANWYANLKEQKRNEFLSYAWTWIWNNAPNAHLEMPGIRPVEVPAAKPRIYTYIANTRSKNCPEGFNQEETIKEIWNDLRYKDCSKKNIKSLDDDLFSNENVVLKRKYSLDDLYDYYRLYGDFNLPEEI